jgi:hypothetical protein
VTLGYHVSYRSSNRLNLVLKHTADCDYDEIRLNGGTKCYQAPVSRSNSNSPKELHLQQAYFSKKADVFAAGIIFGKPQENKPFIILQLNKFYS